MPTRIVREGILTSERVNALSPLAELFYRRLMSVADDHGRYSGNLTLIRSSCFPLRVDSVKEDSIRKHLAECIDAGLIVPYTVDSRPYILLLDFGQRINGKSKFPEPLQGVSDVPRESPGIPGKTRSVVDVDVGEGVVEDESKKSKSVRFAPPSLDDVQSYVTERGSKIDAQKFIDHYTANGWRVGRNAMRDWKAAVRTWEASEKQQPRAGPMPTQSKTLTAIQTLEGMKNGLAQNRIADRIPEIALPWTGSDAGH